MHNTAIVLWQPPWLINSQALPIDPDTRDWHAQIDHQSQAADLDELIQVCNSLLEQQNVLIVRADMLLPDAFLQRFSTWLNQQEGLHAASVTTNADPGFNPFGYGTVATRPADSDSCNQLDALVSNTSLRATVIGQQWPLHLLWLDHSTIAKLAAQDGGFAHRKPHHQGVRLLVCDQLFTALPGYPVIQKRPDYEWDFLPATPIEYRHAVLQTLLQSPDAVLPRLSHPAILHISHSWGGGLARWIDNYIAADDEHDHLVLQSSGFWKTHTYGTTISLHQGKTDGPVLASWSLVPAIASSEFEHQQYRELLNRLLASYQIKRVIISSLIGHSFDALRTRLPTVQVVHDYYPSWPLLSEAPASQAAAVSLPERYPTAEKPEFIDRQPEDWVALARVWAFLLQSQKIQLIAPSCSARDQLTTLQPDIDPNKIVVIPHGLPDWNNVTAGPSLPDRAVPKTTKTLHLVMPGRLLRGKGRQLLLDSLNSLPVNCQITLLGAGRDAHFAFGHAKLNVINDYQLNDLPQLIKRLQPDAALLLSTVAETFSYTLSEMQALGLPVIATRRGSFIERIDHESNGLLIEVEADALSAAVRRLLAEPDLLATLQHNARQHQPMQLSEMLAAYETAWHALEQNRPTITPADQKPALLSLTEAQQSVHQRLSFWGLAEVEQQRQKVQAVYAKQASQRQQLVQQQRQCKALQTQLNQAARQVQEKAMEHARLQNQHEQQRLDFEARIQAREAQDRHEHQQLLQLTGSRSWRLTRPLRFASRFAGALVRHKAYNPLRWPGLGSRFLRGTLTNGLMQTLRQATTVSDLPVAPPAIGDSPITVVVNEQAEQQQPGHNGQILVIDAWVPRADRDSGSLRLINLMRVLTEMNWQVNFASRHLLADEPGISSIEKIGVTCLRKPEFSSVRQLLKKTGERYSMVILSRHYIAAEYCRLVRQYCPNANMVFDTVDLHYLREERLAALQNSKNLQRLAKQTRHQELSLVRDSDMTFVVSPVEKSILEAAAPDARIEVVSNIYPPAERRNAFAARQDVIFVGGFKHPPNIDAVKWLCETIWPHVEARLGEVKLHIIGSHMPEKLHDYASNRIIMHGYSNELDHWLDHSRIAVAPLLYGAGVKGKINSAMQRGLPVVATSTGIEGMYLENGHDVLVADEPEAFAGHIVTLYQNETLWEQLSTAGMANIDEHFSLSVAREKLTQLLTPE